jgi:GalNAc-alpha-(1->4)-GalNAc-alpha-(1->3)-diNAcBac-PP-undecaprenol alpha-1,4-N-acetyl-D-galactosaminyltransferase
MKAFIIIPTITTGGAERVAAELCNNWSSNEKNIQVHLVLLVGAEIYYPINDKVIVHKLNLKINQKGIFKLFSLLKLFYDLRKLTKQIKPDFIFSFMNKYNVFVLITLFKSGFKIIVSERGSPTERIPRITSFLRKKTYKTAHGVLCQTTLSKDYIIKETGNKNVISIPNPIKKIDVFQNIDREKVILNVGRLVKEKGQKYLLESFSKLNCNDWKLIILGDGPLLSELQEYSKRLNISERVVFMGNIQNIDEWYKKSSIFAFSSILEGFPNALAEAMAYGLPCVSFDCKTGPSDLIINGINGFLTKEGDVNDFTLKIQELIDNFELREKFSIESRKLRAQLNSESISQLYLDFCIK